jgi:hypothetical protein
MMLALRQLIKRILPIVPTPPAIVPITFVRATHPRADQRAGFLHQATRPLRRGQATTQAECSDER